MRVGEHVLPGDVADHPLVDELDGDMEIFGAGLLGEAVGARHERHDAEDRGLAVERHQVFRDRFRRVGVVRAGDFGHQRAQLATAGATVGSAAA